MSALEDSLFDKLELLNGRLWEGKVDRRKIERWLENFSVSDQADRQQNRDHALYLLSQFVYFGLGEVRELLKALFRDHYRYPIISEYRRANQDTADIVAIHQHFQNELAGTRFLGIGNPAESGTHLLYYFRQENRLPKKQFCSELDLVSGRYDDTDTKLSDPSISRLVFIDDFCGSGHQARSYSSKMLGLLQDIASRSGVTLRTSYLVLVAMREGMDRVREETDFDHAAAVFELDETYRCLEPSARQFASAPTSIDQQIARKLAEEYGVRLWSAHPLGYNDSQLLLGFHHNVPDNSLPILWWDEGADWNPVFPRYHKIY